MPQDSKIEWCDDSASAWWGCSVCASGCSSCYARTIADRFAPVDIWGKHAPRMAISSFAKTLRALDRKAAKAGKPRIVFINSMSDFFEDHDGPVIDRAGNKLWSESDGYGNYASGGYFTRERKIADLRLEAFKLFDGLKNLRFLLLTKRPENIPKMWPGVAGAPDDLGGDVQTLSLYRQNVWLGCSVSDQATFDRNVPHLLACREYCPVLFLSAEPLLGPINMHQFLCKHYNHERPEQRYGHYCGTRPGGTWVIVGVESNGKRVGRLGEFLDENYYHGGTKAILEQCERAGVAAFNKQMPWGGLVSHDPAIWPEWARVRQFPAVATPAP